MKYTKIIKPNTTKTQIIESDRVDFYRQYGWEPEITEVPVKKKTVKAEPAVEVTVTSSQEVGTDDNKGE